MCRLPRDKTLRPNIWPFLDLACDLQIIKSHLMGITA